MAGSRDGNDLAQVDRPHFRGDCGVELLHPTFIGENGLDGL